MAWYDSIVDLGTAATDAYSTVKTANTPAAAPAAPASSLPTWVMPVAIGGGVLLLLVVVLGSLKK